MKILKDDIHEAARELQMNGLVLFPTETVYGLGANALSQEAVSKIFKVKGRPSNNPLIVHLKSVDEITKYAYIQNDVEKKLIDTFMPGPFTIILKKRDCIPSNVTCSMDTVGIRVPNNKLANQLLCLSDVPIAAPSANLSTKPSGTKVSDIIKDFDGLVPYIIDGGDTLVGLESTVVKVIDGVPTILRPGFVTKEEIEKVCLKCNVINEVLNPPKTDKVESPGVLFKHYAPKSPCLLVYSNDSKKLKGLITDNLTDKTLIIGSDNVKDIPCYKFLHYGNSYEEIAHNIYALLREADKYNPTLIIIEGVKMEGLGLAIMNRLLRSAGFNYLQR